MDNLKKRVICILSVLVMTMTCLSGCQGMTLITEKAASLTIPSNGIVKKAKLDDIKRNGKSVTYKGSANGIAYEWTFIGSEIKKTSDVNLRVSFKTNDGKEIVKQTKGQKYLPVTFAQKGELSGTPTLAINFGSGWEDGTYYLYSGGINPSSKTETTAVVNPSATSSKTSCDKSLNISKPCYVCNAQIVNGICYLNLKRVYGEYFITAKMLSSEVSKSNSMSQANSSGKSAINKSADSSNINVPDADGNNYDNGYGNGHPAPWTDPPQNKSKIAGNVTVSIRCDTAVANWKGLRPNKQDHKVVPANGAIYSTHTSSIYKNETVYDLLVSICKSNNIQEEHTYTPAYKAEYIRGINNLYEFDGGQLSGWMYCVNGWYPNYGCSRYVLQNGDNVQWNYTCDLGRDLGQNWLS